jgi:hypothetical protein
MSHPGILENLSSSNDGVKQEKLRAGKKRPPELDCRK